MHPLIFTLGLLTTGWIALSLTFMPARYDATTIGLAALMWMATAGLAWARWVRKPAIWLWRLAAMTALAMVVMAVGAWAQQTDVFVDYRGSRCPPRTGTFWKLPAAWIGGVGLLGVAAWRNPFRRPRLQDLRKARHWLWWSLIVAWTALCGYVLIRNINVDVFTRSLKALAIMAGTALLLFLGGAGVSWLTGIPRRHRRQQAQADFSALKATQKQDIRDLVNRQAHQGDQTLYYAVTDAEAWRLEHAHIGGSVLMPAHEAWPVSKEGRPTVFLLQIPLANVLPSPWPGRLIALWLAPDDFEVLVRSEGSVDGLSERAAPACTSSNELNDVRRQGLHAMALPRPPDGDIDEHDICESLLAGNAELRTAVAALTSEPEMLLPMILEDRPDAWAPSVFHGVWVGGAPLLIQNAHDATCEHCGEPMRFLFSTGDVTESMAFGDSGVAYIYGCDSHPDCCKAFVDCL